MNLLFVIDGDLNTLSGGYLYDRKLLQHLHRSGDRVRVLSLATGSYLRRLLTNRSASLVDTLLTPGFDLIVQDELSHPALLWINRQVRRRGGPPIVSLVHHLSCDEDHGRIMRAGLQIAERSYLRTVDAILANTATTAGRVRDIGGRDLPTAVALPASSLPGDPLSQHDLERRLADRSAPLRILFVGNLIPRKRPDVLLDALAELRAEGVEVSATIVGGDHLDRPYAAGLQAAAQPLVRAGVVTFTGPRTGDDLARFYRDHDVLAVPSSYEGFGMVYLEGMACGLPALGAAAGGAREIIRHRENGWLVDTGDVESLTEHLRMLARDRDRLAVMSRVARASFDAHPTWTESMDGARRFLLEVAAR